MVNDDFSDTFRLIYDFTANGFSRRELRDCYVEDRARLAAQKTRYKIVTATPSMLKLLTGVSGRAKAIERLTNFFKVFTRRRSKSACGGSSLSQARAQHVGRRDLCIAGESARDGSERSLDVAVMIEVIGQSAVASPLIEYKRNMVVNGAYAAFTVSQMMKDLNTKTRVSPQGRCPMPLVVQLRQLYESVFVNGCGDLDFFMLVREAARTVGVSREKRGTGLTGLVLNRQAKRSADENLQSRWLTSSLS
jgi:NAD-binding of NADP-dependent 3-hydroxyisobutyrate dehydrogenase